MDNKYKSLNTYLVDSLTTETINEAISDYFKKLFGNKSNSASSKETDAAKGFLGAIGGFFSKIFGGEQNDTYAKKMRELEEESKRKEEEREKKLEESEEAALIAKLEHDHALEQNQLNIANNKKISAYNVKKQQLENAKKFWEKNLTEFTSEEIEAYQRTVNDQFEQMGALKSSVQEMNDLLVTICCDENGNTLSKDEILQKAKEDKDFKERLDRFNELAKKHNKAIEEGMDSDAFKKVIEKYQFNGTEYANAENYKNSKNDELENFEKVSKCVGEFKKANENFTNAKEKYKKEKDNLDTFSTGKIGDEDDIYSVDDKGNVTIKAEKDKIKSALISYTKNLSNNNEIKDEKGNIDITKYLAELEKKGIPQSVRDKIKDADINSIFNTDDNTIKDTFNELKDSYWDEIKNGMEKNLQNKANELINNVKTAESELESNPKPDKNSKEYELIKNLNDQEMGEYDTSTEAGKKNKEIIEKEKKEAEQEFKNIEDKKRERILKREQKIKEYNGSKGVRVPDELKSKVENLNKGLGTGETKKDGKVGFINKEGKFIERPGLNASDKEKNDYEKLRKSHVYTMDMEKYSKPIEILHRDGKYYLKDGDEEVEVNKEEAAAAYASNINKVEQQQLITKEKQDFAKSIKSCIKDGKLDSKTFKSLPMETREAISTILSSENGIESCFKGVDIVGDTTINDIKKALNKNKNDILTYIDELNSDDKLDDNEEGGVSDEEIEDENADDEDEIESDEDSDEDDNKNEDGDELVKGDDGKWYKKNEDGEPDVEAGEQTAIKKKKIIKNPSKTWKRRKKKNGKGQTKSYYDKDGNSISSKEYKEKIEAYKNKKSSSEKNESQNKYLFYNTLSQYLIDNKSEINNYTNLNKYLNSLIN